METKKIGIDKDGLDVEFEFDGEKIKLTNLGSAKELSVAHSYLAAVICEEFFEFAKMHADEKGVEISDVFESKGQLDGAMQRYLGDFIRLLIECAIANADANYELFKRKKEGRKSKRCDA